MSQQLGDSIKICPQREQHRCERVAARVIGYRFGYSRLCRPSLQVCGKVRVIGQALENKTACICALPLSQPPAACTPNGT